MCDVPLNTSKVLRKKSSIKDWCDFISSLCDGISRSKSFRGPWEDFNGWKGTGTGWIEVNPFSRDVTAAILEYQNKETAAILMYQIKPLGIEFNFFANVVICFIQYGCLLREGKRSMSYGKGLWGAINTHRTRHHGAVSFSFFKAFFWEIITQTWQLHTCPDQSAANWDSCRIRPILKDETLNYIVATTVDFWSSFRGLH